MGSVRPRLGELLLARGACTREQLRAAWEQKVLFGDRLGTNLLAIGAASEETVAVALGVQFGLHAGHGKVLRVDKSALDLIPAKQADKSGIVPHHVADKTLYLLMRDPLDVMAIDEVRFRTNLRVAPVVICEARLWQLLELHYGVRASLRPIDLDGTSRGAFTVQRNTRGAPRPTHELPEETGPLAVADLVSQADFERLYAGMHDAPNLVRGAEAPPDAEGATAEVSAPLAGQPPEVSADGPDFLAPPRAKDWTTWRDAIEKTSPMLARPVLSDENARSTDGAVIELVETQPTLVTPQEPRHQQTLDLHQAISAAGEAQDDVEQPLSINAAEVLLRGAEDRTAIGKLILRAARARFSRACLLTVFPDRVTGWLGIGEGFETATLRNVLIDRQAQSVFQLVVQSRAHYVGPLRRYPAHGAWVKSTGRQIPKSVAVFPILVRGRPVNLLLVDNGHDQHVNADVGEILILAQAIAKSYEGLLQTL